MENHIFIYNEIGMFGNTSDEIQAEINKHPKAKELVVHLSSPGGEVFVGWTIGNLLKNSGKKVTVIIEGLCASIATYIALQADKVEMAETGRFMIHNPQILTEGEEKDLKAAADQLASIKSDLIKTYKAKTGLEESRISEMMDSETWLNPEEAKELGFIDSIIGDVKAVAKLNSNNIHKMEQNKKSKLDLLTEKLSLAGDMLVNALNGTPTNVNVELGDGTTIFVESEDGELEGKKAFVTDEEGNKTDVMVAEGTHDLNDGRSITVDGEGVITSVQEIEAKQDDELTNRITELEKQNQELTAKLEAKETIDNTASEKEEEKMESLTTQVETLVNEINNIKKMTVGGEPVIAKANVKPKSATSEIGNAPSSGLGAWGKKILKA